MTLHDAADGLSTTHESERRADEPSGQGVLTRAAAGARAAVTRSATASAWTTWCRCPAATRSASTARATRC